MLVKFDLYSRVMTEFCYNGRTLFLFLFIPMSFVCADGLCFSFFLNLSDSKEISQEVCQPVRLKLQDFQILSYPWFVSVGNASGVWQTFMVLMRLNFSKIHCFLASQISIGRCGLLSVILTGIVVDLLIAQLLLSLELQHFTFLT